MADSVFSVLCPVALRYVGAEGVDRVVGLLGEHLSDQEQRLTKAPQPGRSVLVVAVRYYFQRKVEEDAELARRLQFTAMESLTESQQQGFRQLDEGLKAHADRVEAVMADLAEVAAELRDLAGDLRGSALDMRSEMEKMPGEHKELYARVLHMLEQQEMHQRPVHGGDSLSIRSDNERRKVKEFLAHYGQMLEEHKRAALALLNGLGKLQVATGDSGEPLAAAIVPVSMYAVFTAASAFASLCGFLMLRRKNFTLSVIGSCAAMLPIGVCCIAGLPVGIWRLTTLFKPEVQATFP